jgi:hypothetical protein
MAMLALAHLAQTITQVAAGVVLVRLEVRPLAIMAATAAQVKHLQLLVHP